MSRARPVLCVSSACTCKTLACDAARGAVVDRVRFSWLFSVPLLIAAACGSSGADGPAPAADDGGAPTAKLDGGRDATVGPVGPSSATVRCTSPKPSPGVYVVPDAPVADASVPDGAGESDAGAGDAESDAGTDGGVDGGSTPDAGPPLVSPVRRPRVPSAGGPVLAMPRWVPVFYQDTEDQPDIVDFLGSIGCTDYWHSVAYEYGIGEGVSADPVVVTEDAPARQADSQIQKWLLKLLTEGKVEKPTPNTVYVLFYPSSTTVTEASGTSCRDFGGYHFEVNFEGQTVPYAVIPRCGNLDELTSTVTHELIEATTDPFPQSNPAYSSPSEDDLVWAVASGGEVGDLCTFVDEASVTPDGYPYAVQRSFSNRASIEGHDPCVPASRPFVYAAPAVETVDCSDCGGPTQGVFVPAGTTRHVDVTLGSDAAAVQSMQVVVLSGSKLHLQAPTGAGSTFALDRSSGAPGDHLTLTISASAGASESEVFALITSYQGRRHHWYGLVTH